ncbi:hypothetical protein BDV95DRAFT_612046 [Massariosphaeria phaeospora]|uniref:Uncharacterized protein n=1 Tax=Massariosphaeria phaeospora TaxID=100035 RepID=A0A7C8M5C9_9PLEO|nr:hypothetical protein BDV95DRAFT_612046 [Massariosphaeria phaeospora]
MEAHPPPRAVLAHHPPTPTPTQHQHQQQQQHQHRQPQLQLDAAPGHASSILNEKSAYQVDVRAHRSSKDTSGRGHDSVISHPFSPKASSPPSLRSSVSSAGKGPRRPTSEIQPVSDVNSVAYPPRAYIDPEKAQYSAPGSDGRSPNRGSRSNQDPNAAIYDSGEYHEKGPEEKPLQLLLYLSGPCVVLSFGISVWTLFCVLVALLLQPLRICSTRPSLSSQLTTFLAPPLNLQLHAIYSCSSATEYSPAMLVVVHLFSPVVAGGVAVAAWTAACFWFFSMILGDPGGQDGHNDGKESILGVRSWWDRWLSRALR